MGPPTLGLAPPADPELDDASPGRRSVRRTGRRVRTRVRRRGASPQLRIDHRRARRQRLCGRAHRTRRLRMARVDVRTERSALEPSSSPPGPARPSASRLSRRRCRHHCERSVHWSTRTPMPSRTVGCWWSERPRQGHRSPMSSPGPVGVSCSQSANTSGRSASYRGHDLYWWLERTGLLDERYDTVDDVRRVRATPSFQLVGSDDGRRVDLDALQSRGVQLAGPPGRQRAGAGDLFRVPRQRLRVRRPQVGAPALTIRSVRVRTRTRRPDRPLASGTHDRSRTAPRGPNGRAAHRDLGDRAHPDIPRHRRARVRPTRAPRARRWHRGHDRLVRAGPSRSSGVDARPSSMVPVPMPRPSPSGSTLTSRAGTSRSRPSGRGRRGS